jgi:Delta24-sterol reductase
MDRLVEATLKHGLIPPVVMEFPGITVGGGYAGRAGESSSFKHGYFDNTVISTEVVLGNGDVVNASPSQNADLFFGGASALGSLGITTLLEIKLLDAKRYVKTTYLRQNSIADAIHAIRAATQNQQNDYVDGIVYSESHAVAILGESTDNMPDSETVQTFSHAFDPWFYLHVKERTRDFSSPVVEYIPLAEYLFR